MAAADRVVLPRSASGLGVLQASYNSYVLGTAYDLSISVSAGTITVSYNKS